MEMFFMIGLAERSIKLNLKFNLCCGGRDVKIGSRVATPQRPMDCSYQDRQRVKRAETFE